jgi:hypothetical protein
MKEEATVESRRVEEVMWENEEAKGIIKKCKV